MKGCKLKFFFFSGREIFTVLLYQVREFSPKRAFGGAKAEGTVLLLARANVMVILRQTVDILRKGRRREVLR